MARTRAAQNPQLSLVSLTDRPSQRRTLRSPAWPFNTKAKPYEIYPFHISPVLPGESLQSALVQATVISDPIKNALIGWHHEMFFFYVKHRALSHWDTGGLLQTMMLDITTNTAPLRANAADRPEYYTFKDGMDYTKACVEACVTEFFRDEDETFAPTLDRFPAAQVPQENWMQSLKAELATGDDNELPGLDEQEELDILPGWSTQYAQWEIMRDQGMTDLTYEDYLRSYGVNIPKSEDEGGTPDQRHRPELIRHIRQFTQPSNTVEASTGVPSSVVYWKINEKLDKVRFFKEPGFIVGLAVTRPKLFMGNQKGSAIGLLRDYSSWLPAVFDGLPYTSVQENLDDPLSGIFRNQTDDYWLDLKDLYLYGDQFVNYAPTAQDTHSVALPAVGTAHRYPALADVKALFKTVGAEDIKMEGVVFTNVLSKLTETTP